MFDLKTVAQESTGDADGHVIKLEDRNEEPYLDAAGEPVTLTVLGKYAEPVRRQQDANLRRLLKKRQARSTPEEIRENRVSVATAAVTAWSGIEADGKPVPFSAANVREVLIAAPWVLEQVEAAMEAGAGFTPSRSGNS
jgi:hypothetical protein